MKLFTYIISQENIDRHLLSLIETETVYKSGLKSKCVIGSLKNINKPVSAENIIYNPEFIELFIKTIKSTALQSEELINSARQQETGFIYITDNRSVSKNETKPSDIIGAFEVVNGQINADSFQANNRYEIVSNDGLFNLPSIFEENILTAITL